ncbi:MAG TPA: hypothetical protein VFU06_09455 [Longimicrobiales bacterium]|nr:hypothetical protein [Longimicrobiales bacterium]
MLSVDAGMEEPWGDVPALPAERPPLVRGGWIDRVVAIVAVVAGAVSALRLSESRDRIMVVETRGRRRA